ncbi:MAG: hypothetical protein Q9227_007948 [Pyrenula ochraceoflavens]
MSTETSLSSSDRRKRFQMWYEFIYYIFDSLLVPLIRTNFYVTESNAHRNQLFYFRQDVWQVISRPSLRNIKHSLFEELTPDIARKLLTSESLGCGQLRLLPKSLGARPIVNLRRRNIISKGPGQTLGQSINGRLMPLFGALNYEKQNRSDWLSSALFSVDDLHQRLKTFRMKLFGSERCQRLYFVKVDIQSCFDSIPPGEIVSMVVRLLETPQYRVYRHAEMKPVDTITGTSSNIAKRFFHKATSAFDTRDNFASAVADLAKIKKRTIFVNLGNDQIWDTTKLNQMLEEHAKQNIVKIGREYFRQKKGIPQGSVLSSLLCSFFYGQFEQEHLDFLRDEQSLLLRLIDDFLLITTNKNHAVRFLETMAKGSERYGIKMNPEKSLANFNVSFAKIPIAKLPKDANFPYCGMQIGTQTLEVSKDKGRNQPSISNTLTVEFGRRPAQSFQRKTLAALKIQLHAMLLDTSLNSSYQVLASLYQSFMEAGMKMHRYIIALPKRQQPRTSIVIDTLQSLLKLAAILVKSKRSKAVPDYECSLARNQINWVGATAVERVLSRKQSKYAAVLVWLEGVKSSSRSGIMMEDTRLEQLAVGAAAALAHYKY